jgi:hypothetical protein
MITVQVAAQRFGMRGTTLSQDVIEVNHFTNGPNVYLVVSNNKTGKIQSWSISVEDWNKLNSAVHSQWLFIKDPGTVEPGN